MAASPSLRSESFREVPDTGLSDIFPTQLSIFDSDSFVPELVVHMKPVDTSA